MPTKSREREPERKRALIELRFPSENRYLHMVHQLTKNLAEATGFEAVEAEPASEAIVDAVAVEVAAPGQTWEAFVERFSELLESRRLPLDASKQIADIVGVPTLVKIASDPAKLAAAYDALDAIATEPEAGA